MADGEAASTATAAGFALAVGAFAFGLAAGFGGALASAGTLAEVFPEAALLEGALAVVVFDFAVEGLAVPALLAFAGAFAVAAGSAGAAAFAGLALACGFAATSGLAAASISAVLTVPDVPDDFVNGASLTALVRPAGRPPAFALVVVTQRRKNSAASGML